MIRCAALLIALICVTAPPAAAEGCRLKRLAWLDSRLTEGGSLVIPAMIEEKEAWLGLDTGADLSMLSEEFIAAAGIRRMNIFRDDIRDAAGNKIGGFVEVSPLQVGPLKRTKKTQLLVWPGGEPGVDGIFGEDFLSAYDVEIDMARKKVGLYVKGECRGQVVHWASEYAAIPFHDQTREGVVKVALDGQLLNAFLDTGASNTVLDLDTAKRVFGFDPGSLGLSPSGEWILATGKTTPSYLVQFNVLDLSGIAFHNVPVVIADLDMERVDMLLGMRELSLLHMFIAYGERTLYATPAQAAISASSGAP
jgi:predicted aspartyl protease